MPFVKGRREGQSKMEGGGTLNIDAGGMTPRKSRGLVARDKPTVKAGSGKEENLATSNRYLVV